MLAAVVAPLCLLVACLTLEAQERLKLKLADTLRRVCPGPAVAGAAAAAGGGCQPSCGVVPDVSAVVLLLDGSEGLLAARCGQGGSQAGELQELTPVSAAGRASGGKRG